MDEDSYKPRYYLLDENHVVHPIDDVLEWARAFEGKDKRRVAWTEINGIAISTVFLGLDHSFRGGGPPEIFETMVFGGKYDQRPYRTSTWEEALKEHNYVVDLVKEDKWGQFTNYWKGLIPRRIRNFASYWVWRWRIRSASRALKKWSATIAPSSPTSSNSSQGKDRSFSTILWQKINKSRTFLSHIFNK